MSFIHIIQLYNYNTSITILNYTSVTENKDIDLTRSCLYDHITNYINTKEYSKAITDLEFLINGEKNINNKQRIMVKLGYCLYKHKQYIKCYKIFKKFSKEFEKNEHTDYVLFMTVKSLFKLHKGNSDILFSISDKTKRNAKYIEKAKIILEKLIKEYPKSIYTEYAYKHIDTVNNFIIQHILHIAKYYEKLENYEAALVRVNSISSIRQNGLLTKEEETYKQTLLDKISKKHTQPDIFLKNI